jgi:hypothetical protein
MDHAGFDGFFSAVRMRECERLLMRAICEIETSTGRAKRSPLRRSVSARSLDRGSHYQPRRMMFRMVGVRTHPRWEPALHTDQLAG